MNVKHRILRGGVGAVVLTMAVSAAPAPVASAPAHDDSPGKRPYHCTTRTGGGDFNYPGPAASTTYDKRLVKQGIAVITGGIAVAAFLSASATSTSAVEDTSGDGSAQAASARICEESDDAGENGAKGCFEDRGDNWYACDFDEGASGIAWVRAWEGPTRSGPWHRRGTELDDNVGSDGCDKGPEVNINEGNFIRLKICISQSAIFAGVTS